MSATVVIEEAIGPAGDLQTLGSYVHLLSADVHSRQAAGAWADSELTPSSPRSYERWLRMKLTGSYGSVGFFRFWAPNLEVPDGWAIRLGHTDSYQRPTDGVSSIATTDLPISTPGEANAGSAFLPGPGPRYSEWIVVQASITDFAVVSAGPVMASTGIEVVTPTLINFTFGWFES